jgi:serine/threonine-protein kinase
VIAAGAFAWKRLAAKPTSPVPPETAATSAAPPDASSAAPDPTSTAVVSSARSPQNDAPTLAWTSLIRDGQQALATGDTKAATRLFKEAFDKGGGHGVPRTLLEHLGSAISSGDRAACHITGLARPRTYDLVPGGRAVASGRPSIAVGPHGAVMTWTDAHEGNEHAYAVALDDSLRNAGVPVDITPEGSGVQRPWLERAGDRFVVAYADGKGPEAGVHARLLDAEGHIAGPSVQVAAPKSGWLWPTIAGAPDGSFYVAWTEEADTDSEDLFLRHLGPALELTADAVRATDFVPAGPSKARARFPSIAVVANAVLVSFRLERDPLRLIEHLRLPLADAAKGVGLAAKGDHKADRHVGDLALVNTDKGKADGPSLACGGAGCFLGWHAEQGGGAWAAYIDPAAAQPLLRRHFAKQGSHPAVAMAPSGQAQLVWYEGGRVLTASMGKDGMGTASRVARVSGEQPMPSIVAGQKPGEWYVAWLDYETGHLEPYAARVLCR